jgi:4-amino-4-deoxy-L-arabinose transferase-like glycosyltransferase
VDEAHYALYGLFPDWSYFDHPPLVGWLQAVVLLFSDSELALRLWPLFLTVIATWLVYRLSRELFSRATSWTPFVAVLLLHSALVFQLLGIALVPEVPLLVLGLAATLFLWRVSLTNRWRDWLLLGLFLGLAGLAKYTAVTLAAGTVLFLLWQSGWRSLLNPRLWLSAAVALMIIFPVLYWNNLHDWISFRYQLGHGLPDRAWSLKRFAIAAAGQVLAYGPAVVVFGIAAMSAAYRRSDAGTRLSLSMVLPLFLLIAWGAGHEETLPHWTLLGWALLAPLTARWLVEQWQRKGVRVTAWVSVFYSGAMVLLLHSMLHSAWVPFEPYRHPLADLLGWREAADKAALLQRQYGEPVIYVGNWVMASRIAWYARPAAVKVADERYDQFDIWYGAPSKSDRALLLVPDYLEGRDKLNGLGRFERCEQREQFVYRLDDVPVHRFTYYICTGYHG